jgi:hypothetical protein
LRLLFHLKLPAPVVVSQQALLIDLRTTTGQALFCQREFLATVRIGLLSVHFLLIEAARGVD